MALELRDFLVTGNKVAAVGRTTCRVRSTGKVYETDFVHLTTCEADEWHVFRSSSIPMPRGKRFVPDGFTRHSPRYVNHVT